MASLVAWNRSVIGAASLLAAELVDVGAGGEDPLAAGDHDGAGQLGGQLVDRPVAARRAGRTTGR